MASVGQANETYSPSHLVEALRSVSTGQTTVHEMTDHVTTLDGHVYIVGPGNETFINGTDILTAGASKEGSDYVWLTLRLFFIACFITGLIVLTWGSYTIHRKFFDDRPKQKYQKALLL